MLRHPPVGKHTLLDMFECGCNSNYLRYADRAQFMHEQFKKHFNVLNAHCHQFAPCSWSSVVLLEESHLSFHTWAEIKFASADLYTCGKTLPEPAIKLVLDFFKPTRTVRADILRGLEHPSFSVRTIGIDAEVQSFVR